MDTDLYRAFLAVSESGGFSAAARQLNRTQSAVSLQIQRLEADIGAALFMRTSRSVALTAAGERLRPYAQQVLRLQYEARQILHADSRGETVRLGLSEEQAAAYLPALFPEMAQRHPALRLEIVCDVSTAIVALYEAGGLDAALSVRHGPTQSARLLGHERLVWVTRAGREDLAQAADVPLALNPEGCVFRAHAVAALGRAGRHWRQAYSSTSPTGVNLPVQAGLAVTVKTARSVPPGCVALPPDAGLPDPGRVGIDLHRSPARLSEAFGDLVDTLAAIVRRSATLEPAAPVLW